VRYFALLGYVCAVLCSATAPARPQAPAPQNPSPRADFFSGTVTELDAGKITVTRKGLGKDPVTRTFLIDSATKIEGKPRVRGKVNVSFVSSENGDRAVHIIAR
jgi:hypothetical protein